jgi:hypothetical protein
MKTKGNIKLLAFKHQNCGVFRIIGGSCTGIADVWIAKYSADHTSRFDGVGGFLIECSGKSCLFIHHNVQNSLAASITLFLVSSASKSTYSALFTPPSSRMTRAFGAHENI